MMVSMGKFLPSGQTRHHWSREALAEDGDRTWVPVSGGLQSHHPRPAPVMGVAAPRHLEGARLGKAGEQVAERGAQAPPLTAAASPQVT